MSVIQAAAAVIIRNNKNKGNNLNSISINSVQRAQVLEGVAVPVSVAVVICDSCSAHGCRGAEATSVGALSGCWFRCFAYFACFGGLGGTVFSVASAALSARVR